MSYQERVDDFMKQCFGAACAADKVERNHRFLEEALELVQSTGCTAEEAHQLVAYVFGRPVGDPAQEAGGVAVTMAALCNANEIDMGAAAEIELSRVYAVMPKIRAKQAAKPKFGPLPQAAGPLRLDTDSQVFFYEQEFYVLSNFSAFKVFWRHVEFDTLEHAYHWERFYASTSRFAAMHQAFIRDTRSAHAAFKYAQEHKADQRTDWDEIKVQRMRELVRLKAGQHEYVRRKLLETGTRQLIENSWRDPFWGWGPDRNGQNMLGKVWMEVRAELAGHPDVIGGAPSDRVAASRFTDPCVALCRECRVGGRCMRAVV